MNQMTPYNPYINPYLQQPTYQQPVAQQQVTKVNGENGAKAYQMGPNSSALLLDETGTIVWLKMTDGAGFPTITPYDITPHQTAQPVDYSSLESRIARLEEWVNGNSTNTGTIKRKNFKSTDTTDDAAN